MEKIKSTELIATMKDGVECRSLIEFKGKMYLATTNGVYVFDSEKGQFEPLKLVYVGENQEDL